MHIILMMGAPGSGKGTQAAAISDKYNIPKLSSGDIFRSLKNENSPLANQVKVLMDQGILLPDNIVTEVILERLNRDDCKKGFILDGYPRTLQQAKDLDNFLESKSLKIDIVINLEVDKSEIIRRISGRMICKDCGASYNKFDNPPKKQNICDKCHSNNLIIREDDNSNIIEKRMDEYNKLTMPLLDYYREKNIITSLNGNQKLDQITNEIMGLLEKLV